MKLKVLFLFTWIGIFSGELMSQSITRIGAKAGAGTIIAHSADLQPISRSVPFGFNGTVQWMGTGQKNWEVCNCFYFLGVEAFYYNFNDPAVLGAASGIAGTFEPTLWMKEPWRISLGSGIGVSYLNRVYNPIDNPDNIFFSQPLSFLLFVSPSLEYRLSPNWSAQFSLGYNHISNGGRKQPNKGMNFPTLSLGVFRYLSQEDLPQYERKPTVPEWQFYAEAAFTTKSHSESADRQPVFMMAAEAYRPLGAINALGAGLDLSKDNSLESGQPFWGSLTAAPFVAHHFVLGRIDFSQWMAFYLHKPKDYSDSRFYQRYILRYKISPALSGGIGLKVHGHVAENIDIRLGWRLGRR